MSSTSLIDRTMAVIGAAFDKKEPISLLLLRNLHPLHDCKFHSNEGNENVIVERQDTFWWICTNIHTLAPLPWAENGLGEVLYFKQFDTFQQALKECLTVIAIDNDLIDGNTPLFT
jgi:hypothetical protein